MNDTVEPPSADMYLNADAKGHSRIYQVGSGTMVVNAGRFGPTPVVIPVAADGAAPPAVFVGRDKQISGLLTWLDPAGSGPSVTTVSAVVGLAGVGKTSLARHAAAKAVERGWFPGGAVMVDLHGYDPTGPIEAAQVFGPLLRGLGLPGEQVPANEGEQAAVYHRLLAELAAQRRRVLLVLDNASSRQQVAELLPSHNLHRVLITSRHCLPEPDMISLELEVLSPEEAVRLLVQALGRRRPGDRRIASHTGQAAALAGLCGWLPLALQITAALLADDTDLTVEDLLADLRNPSDRLAALAHGDTAVAAAFELSWRHLRGRDQRAARLFRLLTVSPGPDITAEVAAVIADEPAGAARRHLRVLHHAHLIEPAGVPGRWRMHDLVRLYATELSLTVADGDNRDAALDRLLDHYREAVAAAHAWLWSGAGPPAPSDRYRSRDDAIRWLDGERPNLVAAAAAAHQAGRWRHVCALAEHLHVFLELRHHVEDWLELGRLALDAASHIGPGHSGAAAGLLGNACRVARRFDESAAYHQQALKLAVARGDKINEGRSLHNLGLTYFRMGRCGEAETCHRRDLAICIAAGDQMGSAQSMVALGDALRVQQRFPDAIEVLDKAITILARYGDTASLMNARMNLALTWLDWRPEHNEHAGYVIWQLCSALQTAVTLDDRHAQAGIFGNLSRAYLSRCEACHARASRDWSQRAAASFQALSDPFLEACTRQGLAAAEMALGHTDGARTQLWQAVSILDGIGESEQAEHSRQLLQDAPASKRGSRAGCPHKSAEEKAFTAWLDDLPHAMLRGDDGQLDTYQFVGNVVIGARPNAPRTVRPDRQPAAETAEPGDGESLALLRKLTGLADEPAGREVAAALGQQPRALAQAAAVIRREHLTFFAFLARLRSVPAAEYPDHSQADPALTTCIWLNVESVAARHSQASRVLDVLAVLAAEGVDRSMLHAVFAAQKPSAVNRALSLLETASLLTATAGTAVITTDPVIQRVVRHHARQKDTLLATARHVAAVLLDEHGRLVSRGAAVVREGLRFSLQIDALWVSVKPDLSGGEHDDLAEMILRLRAWQLSQMASVMAQAGLGANAAGVAAPGISFGSALVEDCERLLGPGHPETWRARNNLAGLYGVGTAQYDLACALLLQNLRSADDDDAGHPEILTTRHNLGFMHLKAGRPRRARQILGDLLADRERVLGPGDPHTQETRQLLEIAREATQN